MVCGNNHPLVFICSSCVALNSLPKRKHNILNYHVKVNMVKHFSLVQLLPLITYQSKPPHYGPIATNNLVISLHLKVPPMTMLITYPSTPHISPHCNLSHKPKRQILTLTFLSLDGGPSLMFISPSTSSSSPKLIAAPTPYMPQKWCWFINTISQTFKIVNQFLPITWRCEKWPRFHHHLIWPWISHQQPTITSSNQWSNWHQLTMGGVCPNGTSSDMFMPSSSSSSSTGCVLTCKPQNNLQWIITISNLGILKLPTCDPPIAPLIHETNLC